MRGALTWDWPTLDDFLWEYDVIVKESERSHCDYYNAQKLKNLRVLASPRWCINNTECLPNRMLGMV